jgi:hypothetical protein
VEDDLAVAGKELVPDILTPRRSRRALQSRQGERKIRRTCAFTRSVLYPNRAMLRYGSSVRSASHLWRTRFV